MAEARTQLYFFNQIAARPDITIRIPESYHARISRGYERYIVMEYIDVHGFASLEQRARAITDLVSIEPPPGATPGPIGGGRINTPFLNGLNLLSNTHL